MNITENLVKVEDLGVDDGKIAVQGEVIFTEDRTLKSGKTLFSFDLYDGTGNHQVLIVAMDPFRYNIAYKEKIGEKTTYYFYRYGSWGAWQDNSINSSDLEAYLF